MQRQIPKSVLSAVTEMLVPGSSPGDAKKIQSAEYKFPPTRSIVSGRGQVVHFAQKDEYNPQTETTIIEMSESKQYIYGRNTTLQFDITNNSTSSVLYTGLLSSFLNAIRTITIRSKTGTELERIERANVLARYRLLTEASTSWLESSGKRLVGLDQAIAPTKSAHVVLPMFLVSGMFAATPLLPPELISGARIEIEWETAHVAWQWSGTPATATFTSGLYWSGTPSDEPISSPLIANNQSTSLGHGCVIDVTTGGSSITTDTGTAAAPAFYYRKGDTFTLYPLNFGVFKDVAIDTVTPKTGTTQVYTISKPRIVADQYTLHPSIVKELQGRASGGSLMYCFETYSNDRFYSSQTTPTLTSKESLSRVSEAICIIRDTATVGSVTSDSFSGGEATPKATVTGFRYKIGNNYFPLQPIKEETSADFSATTGNQIDAQQLYAVGRLDDTRCGAYISNDGKSLDSPYLGGIPIRMPLDLSAQVGGTGVPISAQRQLVLDLLMGSSTARVFDVYLKHTKAIKIGSSQQLVRV